MIYESIVTNINARFAEWGVPVVCKLGPDKPAEETDLPRVIFIPTTDEFGPRDNVGIRGRNPVAMHSVKAGADVQIWGIDYDSTFELMQQVVRALWLDNTRGIGTEGAYTLDGGEWDNETIIVRYGRLYVLKVTVAIPLRDVNWPYVGPYPETNAIADVAMEFPNDVIEGNVTVTT